MPPLSVMFKTVSSNCNLDCSYCYYRQSREGQRPRREIDRGMIEKFVPEYMAYVADTGAASFSWQGGEPMLIGLDFYRSVVRLQERHGRPGMIVSNDIQTNGLLIDDAWAAFFKEYRFLVGLSLDGPADIHDLARKDRGGRGSFDRARAGAEKLLGHGVDLNILCVIGPHNVGRAEALMRFFEGCGITHLQFMPAMDFQATEPGLPARYRIDAEAYGDFLVELFGIWYRDGKPTVSIRIFDNFLRSYLGMANDLCVHGPRCDSGLIVEYNGDAYPCDFYIHPDFRLGNLSEDPLDAIARGALRAAFVGRKEALPALCRSCEWLPLCNGGCPRNRLRAEDGNLPPDRFCASYRKLLTFASSRLDALGRSVKNRMRYLAEADRPGGDRGRAPGRNEPCLCGSGRKHKLCCGDPALGQSYLFRSP